MIFLDYSFFICRWYQIHWVYVILMRSSQSMRRCEVFAKFAKLANQNYAKLRNLRMRSNIFFAKSSHLAKLENSTSRKPYWPSLSLLVYLEYPQGVGQCYLEYQSTCQIFLFWTWPLGCLIWHWSRFWFGICISA